MQLEISLIISQILAFLIMLWILKKFAWKPLLKILKERKEKIQTEFDKIEVGKKEIEDQKALYNEKLNKIEQEAQEKIELAILKGQQRAQQIQDEAHENAKVILFKAQEGIKSEILKAQDELQKELVHSVIRATEKLVGEKIDVTKDRELIRDMLSRVEKDGSL